MGNSMMFEKPLSICVELLMSLKCRLKKNTYNKIVLIPVSCKM